MPRIGEVRSSLVINVRGVSASGKSHAVRSVMDLYGTEPYQINDAGRPTSYVMNVPSRGRVFVVGDYSIPCGGADLIQPKTDVWPITERLAKLGDVLVESYTVSSAYGDFGRASESLGDRVVFAFLDTPLEVCVARLRARREASGKNKPVNLADLKKRHTYICGTADTIERRHGRRVVVIDYRCPEAGILAILGVSSSTQILTQ